MGFHKVTNVVVTIEMVDNYKSGHKESFKCNNSSVVIPAGNSTFYHNQ